MIDHYVPARKPAKCGEDCTVVQGEMMARIQDIQAALRASSIDSWLFCDNHHRDASAYRILGLPETLMASRRWFYLIPAHGEPVKLSD
jgi:hypothetical protein